MGLDAACNLFEEGPTPLIVPVPFLEHKPPIWSESNFSNCSDVHGRTEESWAGGRSPQRLQDVCRSKKRRWKQCVRLVRQEKVRNDKFSIHMQNKVEVKSRILTVSRISTWNIDTSREAGILHILVNIVKTNLIPSENMSVKIYSQTNIVLFSCVGIWIMYIGQTRLDPNFGKCNVFACYMAPLVDSIVVNMQMYTSLAISLCPLQCLNILKCYNL